MVWGAEPLFPKSTILMDSGGCLDFLSTVSKKGRKREVEGEYQPGGLSSPKFPGAVYIPLSFHSPTSLHGEETEVGRLKRGILVQEPTLFCCVTQGKANDLFMLQFPLL